MADLLLSPAAAAALVDFGRASAAKRGRDPRFPYVPVVLHDVRGGTSSEQILGLAFATRAEALESAERTIAARRTELERKLASPRHRALRRWHGVEPDPDPEPAGRRGPR